MSVDLDCDETYKLPRLYTEADLQSQAEISLSADQAHYLKSVMRRAEGDMLRVFNGRGGEFAARIIALSKRSCAVRLEQRLRAQPDYSYRCHLFFAPLVKGRMDMLIEKAVELGVTDLHPVLTHRTQHRKIKVERLEAQIFEAMEQCERLDRVRLHDLTDLFAVLDGWAGPSIQWCCERASAADRKALGFCADTDQAFLVGPAGGFDLEECTMLGAHDRVVPISLGEAILRAETASFLCLSAHALARLS